MSLFKLINSDVPLAEIAVTPPASQLSTRVPVEHHCRGYLGNFAVEHTLKMNSKCNIDACFACCQKLNMNVASCAAHHGKANKRKHTVADSQGRHLYTRRLEEEEYAKFRGISIKKQAEERMEQAGIELSNKTVTLVVWPGGSANSEVQYLNLSSIPSASRLFRVHAPQWPRLALKESDLLINLITKQLGEGWDEGLQVWSIAERNWIYYPMIPNIASKRQYPPLIPTTTLSSSTITAKSSVMTQTARQESSLNPSMAMIGTPATQANHPLVWLLPLLLAPMEGPIPPPSAPQIPSSAPDLTPSQKWPAGVTMRTMKAFLDATMEPHRELVRDAWHRMFGNHYIYRPSTVTHYRRWLMYINPVDLNNYVARFGNLAVRQGQTHFKDDWAKCDKRYGQRPSKRSR
ncbi:hypothetical protein DFH28DRAFT_920995 [Melampsora americana]|nr:hypothetical protein DFH28DRAFT_920995 [Melampsora americana]